MKYKQALERITQQFVSINYDELSTLEHAILREATVALGWSVVVKGLQRGGEDREIQLEKNQ